MGQAVSGMMGSSLTPSLLLLASNERLKHAMAAAAAVFSSGPIQPLHVQKKAKLGFRQTSHSHCSSAHCIAGASLRQLQRPPLPRKAETLVLDQRRLR